ncbi:hypothetical protein [Planococcus citreus]|uniref:BppU N-terminal domain-containing protein n=1 Tax=Planococcus citreus TaxID=1373 RepID=A0A497YSZ4_9BACL|nr:hypothetical protein [Planococcus citreus]RLJ90114.1 hypothetical protein DFR62_0256 [Planococcus citreus]
MTYKFHTRLDLINGGNIFRQDDKITLGYIARNSNGEAIDFSGKEIMGTIYNRRAGIMFEAEASFDAESQKIIFTITQMLDHGTFEIEFVVTDPGNANYRVVVPSDEYSGRLDIKPSSANIEVTGVRMVTVEQLRSEQQAAQTAYESSVDGKLQDYQTDFTTYKEEVEEVLDAHQRQIIDEFSGFKDSVTKGKVFGTVDDRFEDLEKDSFFPAKNILPKDGFLNNSGWSANFSTLNADGDGWIVTGDGTATFPNVYAGSRITGNKYYSRALVTVLDIVPKLELIVGAVKNKTIFDPVVNQEYSLLGVETAPTTSTLASIQIGLNFNTSSDSLGKRFKVRKRLSLNLTQAFGAGNEPTVEEMDSLLAFYPESWFDGTVNLAENKKFVKFLLNQVRGKANKHQEGWITPTLLNGWTGEVKYRKNQFGVLEVYLKGVSGGALAKPLFNLIASHRPPFFKHFPILTNYVIGRGWIETGGNFVIYSSANTDVHGDLQFYI